MKKTFAVILLISLILLGAAFGLKNVTKNITQKKHVELMETLLPDGKDFLKVNYTGDDEIIRSVHKANNGYVIETVTYGYADEITMLIGVDNDGVVTGLVVYEAHETFGLGNNILTDHVFLSNFLNKTGIFSIGTSGTNVDPDGKEININAITGATVSSKAVTRCVNSAVAYVTGADIQSSATTWGG